MKIIGVAIQRQNGLITSLLAPNRHHHIFKLWEEQSIPREDLYNNIQGFILEDQTFVTREQAFEIALETGQISKNIKILGGRLTSEDLW